MKNKIPLLLFILLMLQMVGMVKAGDVDVTGPFVAFTIHAPDEIVIEDPFSITIGVQATQDLVIDNFLIKIQDVGGEMVYEETVFKNLFVRSYDVPIKKTIKVSISTEGEYSCFIDIRYTVRGESHLVLASFTLGNVRTIVYDELKNKYSSLEASYEEVAFNYNMVKEGYDRVITELANIRNLMYIFLITTIIFVAITVYFAKRKPKTT